MTKEKMQQIILEELKRAQWIMDEDGPRVDPDDSDLEGLAGDIANRLFSEGRVERGALL